MSAVSDTQAPGNLADRETMTEPELRQLAEHTARTLVGVSADEAFRMLEAGEFDGQTVESTLRGLQRLLAA
jgi:hypothetical protein